MRMWMVDPRLLCNQHLIGEHGEIHKFLPSFRKGHKNYKIVSKKYLTWGMNYSRMKFIA